MRFTLKRDNIIIFCIFFLQFIMWGENVFDIAGKYNADVVYDPILNSYKLISKNKKIEFILESPYFLDDTKLVYCGDFIEFHNKNILFDTKIREKAYEMLDGTSKVLVEVSKKLDNIQNKSTPPEVVPVESGSQDGNAYIYKSEPDSVLIKSIIIDPGHGGKDPGTYRHGVKEKDVVLKTSLILERKLKARYKYKNIVVTRTDDTFIPLERRSDIANKVLQKGMTLFVSVHANANVSQKPYGFETWYIVDELKRDIISSGVVSSDRDVEEILNSMVNDELYRESKDLALAIQGKLENQIGSVSKNRGVKESTYFVVKDSKMPAVLVEIGFISNKYEAKRLTNNAYLTKIAQGIADGIDDFIKEYEYTKGFTN